MKIKTKAPRKKPLQIQWVEKTFSLEIRLLAPVAKTPKLALEMPPPTIPATLPLTLQNSRSDTDFLYSEPSAT